MLQRGYFSIHVEARIVIKANTSAYSNELNIQTARSRETGLK